MPRDQFRPAQVFRPTSCRNSSVYICGSSCVRMGVLVRFDPLFSTVQLTVTETLQGSRSTFVLCDRFVFARFRRTFYFSRVLIFFSNAVWFYITIRVSFFM